MSLKLTKHCLCGQVSTDFSLQLRTWMIAQAGASGSKQLDACHLCETSLCVVCPGPPHLQPASAVLNTERFSIGVCPLETNTPPGSSGTLSQRDGTMAMPEYGAKENEAGKTPLLDRLSSARSDYRCFFQGIFQTCNNRWDAGNNAADPSAPHRPHLHLKTRNKKCLPFWDFITM